MKKNSLEIWEKSLLVYKKNSSEIKNLSKSIRYVGVINEYGRTLAGSLKSGIKPLFTKNQIRDEFFAISSFMKLRMRAKSSIGNLNYVILNHKKINSLILQNNKVIYYITFQKNIIPSILLIENGALDISISSLTLKAISGSINGLLNFLDDIFVGSIE